MITNSAPDPKVRLLSGGTVAVISIWDESSWVSKVGVCYEIRNKGRSLANVECEERFVRSELVVARVVAGETLIVPVRAKVGDLASIYTFNGTGTLIWKLLETPKSVTQLATAVTQEYEIESERAERDVAEFVREMKAVGLVEVLAAMAMAGD